MATVRTISLISGASGKPIFTITKKKCSCYKFKTLLVANVDCVDIPKVGGGFRNSRRYCTHCFILVINKTKEDIVEMENTIKALSI